ncbi:hypothetical protein OKA06_15845 [Novosphingobium sp. MW5]|nr:hypothetical protein [Novosphingobium sp. MW5]
MRKIVATVSAIAFVAALGGCSKKEEAAPEAATSEAAPAETAAPSADASAEPSADASGDSHTLDERK